MISDNYSYNNITETPKVHGCIKSKYVNIINSAASILPVLRKTCCYFFSCTSPQRHRRTFLWILLAIPFIHLTCANVNALESTRQLQVDFSFNTESALPKQVAGYRLYMNSSVVCETGPVDPQTMNCTVMADDGTHSFTLSTLYDDGSQSPQSAPFSYTFATTSIPLAASLSASATEGTPPLTVNFDGSASTGDIAHFSWAFGDGGYASGSTASHTYQEAGTYTATLTITGDSGATSQDSTTITTSEPLNASFTAEPVEGETPLAVNYNASASTGQISDYSWSFGDDTTASGATASHTYQAPGTYTTTLTVTDSQGQTEQSSISIVAVAPLTASISADQTEGAIPLSVSFDASSSTGQISSYSWTFGDGTGATGSTASHTYQTAGTFTATLIVTDTGGATRQDDITINAVAPLNADLSASQTSGEAPFTVSYDASASTGQITDYSWTFGDGGTASGQSVSHTYQSVGSYTTTLTVTDATGSTQQATASITVTEPSQPLNAAIVANRLDGEAPLTIVFDGSSSTGGISTYSWTFGDGTSTSGSTVSHLYQEPGTFTATLSVTDSEGTSDQTSVTINVLEPTPITGLDILVDFAFNSPSSQEKQVIGYRLYMDGSPICETGPVDPQAFSCTAPGFEGTYDFTMTALYDDGTESPQSAPFSFNLGASSQELLASVSASSTIGEAPFTLTFDGTGSTGPITSYNWSFGDGETATGATATHTYQLAGYYYATLSVRDNEGLTRQETMVITVTKPSTSQPEGQPTAVIASSIAVGQAPFNVKFDGSGSTSTQPPITTYDWDFGDGNSGMGETAAHTFTEAGTYHTILTVTDSIGLTGQTNTPIIITQPPPGANIPPAVSFTATPNSGTAPLTVSLDASASADSDGTISRYSWSFGDGSAATGTSVEHTFVEVADYTVTLQVTDDDGDSALASKTISVLAEDQIQINFELGELQIDHNWTPVVFSKTINTPVVIAGPLTSNDSEPATTRIRNLNENGFEIRIQEWNYQDGSHDPEIVSFFALEAGAYTLDDGTMLEAGQFTLGTANTSIQLQQEYEQTPIIIGQVLTENETDAVTGRISNVNKTSFQYRLQEQQLTETDHGDETIGYIAWQPGTTTLSSLVSEVGTTGAAVTHNWHELSFQTLFSTTPLIFADMQTLADEDPSRVRIQAPTETSVLLRIEEELSIDGETDHTAEDAGYIILAPAQTP